jgi:hypothetical protein
MAFGFNGPSLSAIIGSGTVAPCRFVSYCTAVASTTGNPGHGGYADFLVYASPSGGTPIGISEQGQQLPPTDENYGTTTWAEGQLIGIYGVGRTCLLELGSTVTAGQLLGPLSDGTGKGGVVSTNATMGAIAKQGGVSGDLIQVIVEVA